MLPIKKRRPRKSEDEAKLRDSSFQYKVRVKRGDQIEEIPVCLKAFVSLHGVTRRRVETIQKSLKTSGISPKDQRGKHSTRPKKISAETMTNIINHIKSFKGRSSHFALKKSKKMYLPEDLSIKKMYNLYQESYSEQATSYELYRKIFNERFNISFGYPRCDTCSTCDEFNVKVKALSNNLLDSERIKALHTRKQLNTQNQEKNCQEEQYEISFV